MREYRVDFNESATRDLEDIYRWVLQQSRDSTTTDRFAERLADACRRIGDRPLAGRSRDDFRQGLRTFAFERKAVIAYLVHDDSVEIANIFYGGRDLDGFYRNEA